MITTGIDNFTIWEGTQEQISHAGISENDLAFVTDVSFEEKFRYSVMPPAIESNVGKIVQYVGGTTDTYIQGAFYKCVYNNIRIDQETYSVLPEQSVYISDESKLKDYMSSIPGVAYMTLTQYGDRSDAYGSLKKYDENDVLINSEGCFWSWMTKYYGISVSGPQYFDNTVYVKFISEGYTWQLINKSDYTDFADLTGDPYDNTNLSNALNEIKDQQIIQVTELPEITEDTKDRIYQYVGDTNTQKGYFKGSFYATKGAQWEYDVENSHLVDDIQFEVFDESKFLSFFVNAILTTYPTATYFDFCFDDGASTSPIRLDVYLDPSISAERYWRDNAMNLGYYAGAIIRGTPTRTSDKTTCTRLRINISTIDSYENWTWIPVSLYPEPKANKVSLYNISVNNTSLIEHACHYQLNDNAANTVLIGVNARNDYYTDIGHQTAVGYNAHVSTFGTAIGCNADAHANAIAIGTNAITNGEYCIVIGTNNVANERSLVIGPSCSTQARYSSAIGFNADVQSNGEKAVALGYNANVNATGAYQLGEGTNNSANTLQFRNYTLLDSNGVIPSSRLSAYSPEDGYALVYDEDTGEAQWKSIIADIPVIQVEEMPEAEEGKVVQYIGKDDGELIKGYWYEAVYDSQGDYWYWNQINVQPTINTVSYDDVTDKPSINGVTIEGDLDLVEDLGLKRVATTGSYADLTTKPGINGHALLANTTAADLQISYNDLIDKPADPTTQLPDLPSDKDDYDYMLKWDHVQGKLVWYRATDEEEDLGILPEPTNE